MKNNIYRKLLVGGLILVALIIIAILVIPPAIHGFTSMSKHAWAGWLSSMLLLAVPISLAGTYYVSSRFRQAVESSMKDPTARNIKSKDELHSEEHIFKDPNQGILQLRAVKLSESLTEPKKNPSWQLLAMAKQHAVLLVYALAGLTYVVIVEVLYLSQIGNISIQAILLLAVAFTPPLTAVIVMSSNRSYRVLFLAVVIHLAVLEGMLRFLGVQPWSDLFQLIVVPIIALLILSNRRMRAVGPMMYVAVLVVLGYLSLGLVFTGFYVIEELGMHFVEPQLANLPLADAAEQWRNHLLSLSPDQMRIKISEVLNDPRSVMTLEHPEQGTWLYIILFFLRFLGFVIVGILISWGYFRWFANRYRQRQASDQMLEVESWWIGFAVVLGIYGFLFSGGWAILWILLVLTVYYTVIFFGFQWAQSRRPKEKPVSLLLLRVFGFDKRTQWLLDSLGSKWRFMGPIMLIAGTDVAHSQMEPHEFFNFISGRLSRQFIRSEADLEQRMRESEDGSDPDGRFRIHEFFCHKYTWQFTVTALIDSADAVLMDLRGFSKTNEGCMFEIQQLLNVVPIGRIQFLVDENTDKDYLNKHIQDIWAKIHISSVNAKAKNQQLTLIEVSERSDESVDAIVRHLMVSAGS